MRKDITAKEYLSDKARIADLINGAVFGGKQMVHPEDIKEMGDQLHYISEVEGSEIESRHHDLIYKIIVGTDTFLFGIQNQSAVDPLMPLRIAEYVVMQYNLEENKKGFSNLEISAYHLIQEVCGIKNADRIRKMRTENGQEVIDMCQAIDDLIFEGKAEGKAEAIAETVIAMIRTKIKRGEDVWHIADALELGINEVEPLYKLLQKYPGEENLQIAKRYMKLTM